MNLFHSFITMILQSIHVHDNKKIENSDVNSFLNGLFTNVTKFKALLEYRNDLNEFFKTILYEMVSDEFFFENFSDKNRPIFELEAISILHALDHFKRDICNAKLNIIANDSRVSFFLLVLKYSNLAKNLLIGA